MNKYLSDADETFVGDYLPSKTVGTRCYINNHGRCTEPREMQVMCERPRTMASGCDTFRQSDSHFCRRFAETDPIRMPLCVALWALSSIVPAGHVVICLFVWHQSHFPSESPPSRIRAPSAPRCWICPGRRFARNGFAWIVDFFVFVFVSPLQFNTMWVCVGVFVCVCVLKLIERFDSFFLVCRFFRRQFSFHVNTLFVYTVLHVRFHFFSFLFLSYFFWTFNKLVNRKLFHRLFYLFFK